jgi:hypothetical protein
VIIYRQSRERERSLKMEQRELLKRESLRCDDGFLEMLEEDFGIPVYVLKAAFMGFPREQKTVAMVVCGLAEMTPDPARFVLRWSRLNGKGAFREEEV